MPSSDGFSWRINCFPYLPCAKWLTDFLCLPAEIRVNRMLRAKNRIRCDWNFRRNMERRQKSARAHSHNLFAVGLHSSLRRKFNYYWSVSSCKYLYFRYRCLAEITKKVEHNKWSISTHTHARTCTRTDIQRAPRNGVKAIWFSFYFACIFWKSSCLSWKFPKKQ